MKVLLTGEWASEDRSEIDAFVGGTYAGPVFGIDEIAAQEAGAQ